MSLALSMYGAASSFQATSAGDNFLSVIPNGYAALSGTTTINGDIRLEVTFRYTGSVNMAILGTTNVGEWVFLNSTSLITIRGNSANTLSINGSYVQGVWYRLVFTRVGSNATATIVRVSDEVQVGSGSDSTGLLGSYLFRYLARFLNSYLSCDYGIIKIGTPVVPEQHLYIPQSSGTIWTDTGTVGGWDFTLSGSPLPTWES